MCIANFLQNTQEFSLTISIWGTEHRRQCTQHNIYTKVSKNWQGSGLIIKAALHMETGQLIKK